MVETRKEPGCLRTEFMRDRESKNTFYINDIYFNKAGLDFHMTTPHFLRVKAFMEKGGLLEQTMNFPESLNVEEFAGHESSKKDYTVTYFPPHGRGSPLCFMLAKANANWEKKSIDPP